MPTEQDQIVITGDPEIDRKVLEEAAKYNPFSPEQAAVIAIDPLVHQAAKELMPKANAD